MSSSPTEDQAPPPPGVGPPLLAYAVALAVYIGLGYLLRSVVLNWIVGPLFLLAVLHLLPRLVRSPSSESVE